MRDQTWAAQPALRQENGGVGRCNTGAGAPGTCFLRGIGCDVDHIAIQRMNSVQRQLGLERRLARAATITQVGAIGATVCFVALAIVLAVAAWRGA